MSVSIDVPKCGNTRWNTSKTVHYHYRIFFILSIDNYRPVIITLIIIDKLPFRTLKKTKIKKYCKRETDGKKGTKEKNANIKKRFMNIYGRERKLYQNFSIMKRYFCESCQEMQKNDSR